MLTTTRFAHTVTDTLSTLPMRVVRKLTTLALQRLEREHTQPEARPVRKHRSAWLEALSIE